MFKLHTQQGDCIIEIVDSIPEGAKRIELSGPLVVLKGEGVNTHTITETSTIEAYELDGVLYIKTANNPVEIVHQEHGVTTLPAKKIYRRKIEREFDYEEMEARQVRD